MKTLPLSLKIASGTPWARSALISASQTGRAVARRTTWAETQNLEWSSIPETIEAFIRQRSITPPTTSICHSSIAFGRSQRL